MVNLSNKVISSYKVVGAKAGDEPRKPVIAVDSVSSISTAKILYGLNDGEISGIVGGAKGIFLEGTPLEDESGNKNFEGVKWDFRSGTIDQEYIKGFPDVSNEIPVSVELKNSVAWVKAISNPVLSAVRIRLAWNGLKQQNLDNGDVSGYKIEYAIDVKTGSGAYTEVLKTNINDKVSGKYERTHRIELPKSANGWQVRVRRITPNANKENIADKMFVESITEVIDHKFTYPHTSLLGIQYDAKTFSRIAKLSVRAKGKLIKIPSNYNSDTNTYTGIWNGQFKLAYSNNPAWIFYDLVTSKRYGLGKRIDDSMVDKWSLYELGTYCDALVDDGEGGKEKRYSCNVYLQSQTDAYKILSQLTGIFRGITYWSGQQLVISADVPKDPTYTFSRANVVDGNFEYTGTRARDRHTVAKVAFDNPNENFKTEYELVRDEAAIAKFGINILDISAIGCTSRGQAQRAGLWALKSEQLETRTVTFRTGLEGFNVAVGEVIEVSDELLAGRANGGRITAVGADLKTVTLDRDSIVKVNDFISVNTKDGTSQRRKVVEISGNTVTLLTPFVGIDTGSVWALSSSDLTTMQFRIMGIKPDENNIHTITAIQHEPLKYDAVDHGADVKPTNISILKPTNVAPPSTVTVSATYKVVQAATVATLVIQWSQVKDAVGYSVEWRRNNGNWIKIPTTGNVSAEVEGVYEGNYQVRVKSINAFDVESNYTFSSITAIAGKVGNPNALASIKAVGLLFGMAVSWSFKAGSEDTNYTEIETATDASGANTALLGSFSYPTDKTEITGLQGGLTLFYRGRIVDKLGNFGDWSQWVSGTTDASADKVLDLLEGQITETQLYQDLRTKIDLSGTNAVDISGVKADIAAANATLDKAKADILATDGSLATAKGELATAKSDITKAKADITAAKSVADLAKTDSAANKTTIASLTTTVGNNKTSVDSSITTLTNKDLALSNLYTALKSEYDTNKASVSQDLTTLTNKDISLSSLLTALDTDYQGNKTAIRNELTAVSTKTDSTANSLTSLTTEVGKNKTAITTEATTRSTEDTALSNRITTVSGKTDNALSRITTAETTIANNTGAITQQKTDITAAYKKAIDDIEIGGRNLVLDTAIMRTELGTASANITNSDGILTLVSNGSEQWRGSPSIEVKAGVSYTVSIRAKADNLDIGLSMPLYYDNFWQSPYKTYAKDTSGEWITISETFVPVKDSSMRIAIHNHRNTTGIAYYKQVKIEKGNKATDWTAAPEDVEASITAAITTESTARTSAVEAVAKTVTALDTRFEGNKTSVTNALTVLTNKDTSLANSITALTTTVGNNTTAISTESTARSTADTAIGNRITTVEGKTDNALSRVSTVETIAADNKSSIASTNTQVTAAFKAIDDIEVTGRNLFRSSTLGSYGGSVNRPNNGNIILEGNLIKVTANPSDIIGASVINLKGNTLTISGKTNIVGSIDMWATFSNQGQYNITPRTPVINGRFERTISIPTGATSLAIGLGDYPYTKPYTVSELKIENGNEATEWTVAPEDALDFGTANRARLGTVETATATNAGAIANTRTDVVAILDKDIAGKNLVKQGTFPTQAIVDSSDWAINAVIKEAGHGDPLGGSTAIKLGVNNSNSYILKQVPVYETTGIHTLSFWIKGNKSGRLNVSMGVQGISQYIPITTAWAKHTITNNITNINSLYRLVFGGWDSWTDTSLQIFLSHVKLEKGSTATDWTAAPLDASAAIQIEATARANEVSGLYAQYSVKLDVGGRVSGFGLASSATQSDFAINADKFYIAPPTGSSKGTSPFMVLTAAKTINGVSVPAGTYIQSAYIHNGSIDIAKINKASITNLQALTANIGHFKSAPSGARLEIQDSLLSVYDANNRLRVRLGLW